MTNEELVLEYQSGDDNALEALYSQNAKMIEKVIRKYAGVEELDDLRQEAYFGIYRAAALWNPEKDCNFITYAVYWIRAAIVRYIEECGGVVRIPSHRRAVMIRYNKAVNGYRVRFGNYPSDIELCVLLGLNQEQLEKLKADIQASRIRSTSEVIGGEEDDITLEDTIADENDQYETVIDQIQQEQLSKELWSCVDDLKPQQAGVIRGHYKEGQTLKECGAALGVSTERARQIEQKAIRELRKSRFTGFGSFSKHGSSQEIAVMKLEELSGMSLWN